jgi:hypothetical protein
MRNPSGGSPWSGGSAPDVIIYGFRELTPTVRDEVTAVGYIYCHER